MGEVLKLTGKIARLLSNTSPPDLVLNRHCAECEFQTRCRQKAIEKDDLSLLSGMTEEERKRLNSQGHLHRHPTLLHIPATTTAKAARCQA